MKEIAWVRTIDGESCPREGETSTGRDAVHAWQSPVRVVRESPLAWTDAVNVKCVYVTNEVHGWGGDKLAVEI